MDYLKIYYKFVDYTKNTSPRERLYNRNKKDFRINKKVIYTEKHHIVAKHEGGSDEEYNLIRLLPEEHLFIHSLRYKIFNHREDMLAVRFILNGLSSNEYKMGLTNYDKIKKSIRQHYAFIKQNSYEFRKVHGWQTKEGRKKISEARKNKIPAIDKDGNSMGSVDCNHPKVLSGEWVHHSKGRVAVKNIISEEDLYIDSEEYQKNKDKYILRGPSNKGHKNPRYVAVSNEKMYEDYKNFCICENVIITVNIFAKISILDNEYSKFLPNRFNKTELYNKIKDELMDIPYMIKKSYTKEEKNKYFGGYAPKEYFTIKYGINWDKTFNYPNNIIIPKRKINEN